MNLIRAARAFGASFALVLLGAVAMAVIQLPGTNGPSLGDANANIYTIVDALTKQNQNGFTSGLSVSQTATQVACTQLNLNPFQEVKTSAGTGSVCLPTALPGKLVIIGNASGQTIDIFGSNTFFLSGTQDQINGTAGSTAYTGLTSGKTAVCMTPVGGFWYCGSIS